MWVANSVGSLISVAEAKPPVSGAADTPLLKAFPSADGSVMCCSIVSVRPPELPDMIHHEYAAGRTDFISVPSRGLACFASPQQPK